MKINFVFPKGSHLADCVQKITDGGVDEKTLQFAERYGSSERLTFIDPPPSHEEIKKIMKDHEELLRKMNISSCRSGRYPIHRNTPDMKVEFEGKTHSIQFGSDPNAAPVIPEGWNNEPSE